jgi:hypothetical protein
LKLEKNSAHTNRAQAVSSLNADIVRPQSAAVKVEPERAAVAVELVDAQSRCGWFKAMRFPDMPQLACLNRNAFLLAYIIAFRAWWHDDDDKFNPINLDCGEAAIDYETWGMSRQEFRTARAVLEDHGFATFWATKRGTVGKLIDARLFSVLPSQSNQQGNHKSTIIPTTNEEQEERKSARADHHKTGVSLSRKRLVSRFAKRLPSGYCPKPESVEEVRDFAAKHKDDGDVPVLADPEDRERIVLRFIRWNNKKEWQMDNWKLAFLAFCKHSGLEEYGIDDVPEDWEPCIQ